MRRRAALASAEHLGLEQGDEVVDLGARVGIGVAPDKKRRY
jgi:hypothetical protein